MGPMSEKISLIAGLILERPLCVDCIALKASLTGASVEGYLAVMGRIVDVRRERGGCRACGVTTFVVSTLVGRLPASA